MRISSVKLVPWLAVNLHHLFSNGAAFNTQSRSSLTSDAISRSLLQLNRLRYECDIASLVSDLRLCVLNAAPFENRWCFQKHEAYRLYWRDAHAYRMRYITQPSCVIGIHIMRLRSGSMEWLLWDVAGFWRLWWKEQHQHFSWSAPLFCECAYASVWNTLCERV